MKITLKRALRMKNNVVEVLKDTRTKILAFNRVEEQNQFRDNVAALFDTFAASKKLLLDIKTKVSRATDPVRDLVIEMGELRDTKAMLDSLNTDDSVSFEPVYGDDKLRQVKHKVALNYAFVEKQKAAVQNRIEEVQEALDQHNATTFIELAD